MFPSTHAYLVILLICLFPAPGQTACPPETPELTPEILQSGMGNSHDHGFLWRISKNGNVSYLYGTLHVAKLDWMFPGPRVQQAMEGADTVALELDVMDAGIQSRLARGMENQKSSALPAALQARL
ncbi:MAG: TraB/GumN family protein, partial [Methylomonas sp.]